MLQLYNQVYKLDISDAKDYGRKSHCDISWYPYSLTNCSYFVHRASSNFHSRIMKFHLPALQLIPVPNHP